MAFNPAMLAFLPQVIDAVGKIKEMFGRKSSDEGAAEASATQADERIHALEEAQFRQADAVQQLAVGLQAASEQIRKLEQQLVVLRWAVVGMGIGFGLIAMYLVIS